MKKRACSKKGCTDQVVGRTLGRRHYQQAWRAGAFVNAPLPPREPGQTICPADHKHAASTTCYIQHQCRCVPCSELHTRTAQRRTRLKAYGRFDTGLVDATPVREHMLELAEFGMGYKRVAQVAGIGLTAARNLLWGRQEPGPRYGELQKRIKRETADAILAVQPELANLAGGTSIPSRATHRRLQALVAIGWSQAKLARRLGMGEGNLGALMKRGHVSVRVHFRVAELFEDLWNQLPPLDEARDKAAYTRALALAAERRWLPPMAWDDIDTDTEPPVPDEDSGPDEARVELVVKGERVRLSPAERRLCVDRLHAAFWHDKRIAEALGCNIRTVERIRGELGLLPINQDIAS